MIDYDEGQMEPVMQKCPKARNLVLELGKWDKKDEDPDFKKTYILLRI